MNKITFPSICVRGTVQNGMTLGEYTRGRRHNHPHQINWGNGNWMVGENVDLYSEITQRQDFGRLSNNDEAIALYYTALGLLLGEGYHKIAGIMVGLPVDVYIDEKRAKSTIRSIGQLLKGEHSFMLDGEQITINVGSVGRAAQPVGAFTTWMKQQQRYPDGELWAVCDGGFNTLDTFAVRYPQISHRYTFGENLGMAVACRHFLKDFKGLTGRTISLYQADRYLREKNPKVRYADFLEEIDLNPLKDAALQDLSSRVIGFLRDVWGEPLPFAGIIFAGGEFEALKSYVVSQYAGAFVLDEAVTAIAEGLYYQATMVKSWAGGRVIGLDPGFGSIKIVG